MKTVRRPPYPKWNPGYFPCSSLTPLPLSSRRPSVSFGGFGFRIRLNFNQYRVDPVRNYIGPGRNQLLEFVLVLEQPRLTPLYFVGYCCLMELPKAIFA